VRVLYVNHTATVSGGERSLLDLLETLPARVSPLLASPEGELASLARERGVPVERIHGTAGSLRLHPLHTPKALAEMALAARQVRRLAARSRAELVHANSIRAGIVCGLGRSAVPSLVHVRDCLPPGPLSSATMRLIAATATVVLANSRYTARSVLAAAPAARVEVVYNAVDLTRFDPQRVERQAVRAGLGFETSSFLLGVVAQLTPWKGQDTAIRTLAALRAEGVDARLLLIGAARFTDSATRYDNESYVAELKALAAALGVGEWISWLGEREDVPQLIGALDLLLLPSWEEPFGRAVLEGMALGVPVLATDRGGPAEILEGGRGGLLLPPREPDAWASAAAALARDPARRTRIGDEGRRRAVSEFGLGAHAVAMAALYDRLLAGAAPGHSLQ
jgi:glycosyltransferase involved in cell wall biosynthesis